MNNSTWIAIFVVAVVVLYLNDRRKKKTVPPAAKRESISSAPTSDVPDGQYLVKYIGEKAEGMDRIILSLEINNGELKGTVVPMVFAGAPAKRVLKLAKSGFISRLAFEEAGQANKLEENLIGDTNRSFLIRTKEGKAVSVYAYNEEKIKTFTNKLEKDGTFKG
ncbi:hypothetical protein ACFL0S_10470 [Thermodesulfobacteriota bacterium]